jgi:hypothetical protein
MGRRYIYHEPMVTLATTAPPFINAEWFYLFAINPLLGLVEGLLVAWLLRRPRLRLILSLILANYLSAIMARSALLPPARFWMRPDMPWVEPLWGLGLLAVPAAALFIVTVLVEWPFAWWGIRKGRPGKWRTFAATAAAQLVTFPFILILLISGSDASFVTATTRDSSLGRELPSETTIYYVADGGVSVRLLNIATREGGLLEIIGKDDPEPGNNRLLLCPTEVPGKYALQVDLGPEVDTEGALLTLDDEIVRPSNPGRSGCLKGVDRVVEGLDSRVELGERAMDGMKITSTGASQTLAMALPFARWYPERVSLLPGGLLVFGMAEHIWLLHPDSGRITVLAKGRSPVVTLAGEAGLMGPAQHRPVSGRTSP